MGVHLTIMLCNLYCGQEATVGTERGEETASYREGIRQGCVFLPTCLMCTQNVSYKKLGNTQREEERKSGG